MFAVVFGYRKVCGVGNGVEALVGLKKNRRLGQSRKKLGKTLGV
jgi:hypothetical protein